MKVIKLTALLIASLVILALYLQSKPKLFALVVKGNTIFCEIADTPEKRSLGLMHRASLPKNQGMIFVYPDEQVRTYHMRDVKFPIDIAFINAGGEIVDIQEMDLDQNKKYPSKKPAQYALETNKGWYKQYNITIGEHVKGLEELLILKSKK